MNKLIARIFGKKKIRVMQVDIVERRIISNGYGCSDFGISSNGVLIKKIQCNWIFIHDYRSEEHARDAVEFVSKVTGSLSRVISCKETHFVRVKK